MTLHHCCVICSNRENAERFYGDILGLSVVKEFTLSQELADAIFSVPNSCQVLVFGREDFLVEVFLDSRPHDTKTFNHICLHINDLEGFIAQCDRGKVVVKQVPKGESILTFVADYDGNLFEIKGK